MRAIVLDTETTGIGEGAQVIEAAWQEIEFINGVIKGTFVNRNLYGTDSSISWGAMGVHHITPEDIAGLPLFSNELLQSYDIYIGHKIDFDLGMCKLEGKQSVDTLAMARWLWPEESHTLSALTYMIANIKGKPLAPVREYLRNAHSASTDVILCSNLLHFMCEFQALKTMEELLHFTSECLVPTHMPFGKFKGDHVSTVDPGYRSWYCKQTETDPNIIEAFRRYPYGAKI